jgi:D-beta-D-heptose 7-phosphate kinase/D-beta-D-heptose 1-phosphate adenosyltransferase
VRKSTQQSFKIDQKRLLSIVDRFEGMKVAVVGDLILDHYVWGKVSRVSPEAPVVVVEVTQEESRLGGAANVANNLATLGAKCALIGVVGEDSEGQKLIATINERGIDSKSIRLDAGRSTSLKSRVIAHSQQVVRVDRETTTPISGKILDHVASSVQRELSSGVGLIVSDYGKGVIGEKLLQRIGELRIRAAETGAAPLVLIDPKETNFSHYCNATIVKPNRSEAESASGMKMRNPTDYPVVVDALLRKWSCDLLLITLGEEGMLLADRDGTAPKLTSIRSEVKRVFDVSGAGDTVSATYLLSSAAGASPIEAAFLANLAAGKVVGEIGTATVSAAELKDLIEELV